MDITDLYKYGQKVSVKRGEIISDGIEGSYDEYMYVLEHGLAALTSTNKREMSTSTFFSEAPNASALLRW